MTDRNEKPTGQVARRRWHSPVVREVGTLGNVLKGGGGKLSIPQDDMGDVRKPPGQE